MCICCLSLCVRDLVFLAIVGVLFVSPRTTALHFAFASMSCRLRLSPSPVVLLTCSLVDSRGATDSDMDSCDGPVELGALRIQSTVGSDWSRSVVARPSVSFVRPWAGRFWCHRVVPLRCVDCRRASPHAGGRPFRMLVRFHDSLYRSVSSPFSDLLLSFLVFASRAVLIGSGAPRFVPSCVSRVYCCAPLCMGSFLTPSAGTLFGLPGGYC